MTRQWYEQFRWFFTSSGNLVIGGKSAEQNEEVIKKHIDKNDIVIHTAMPGSPFSVIKAWKEKISSSDIKETVIFTGCFSRAWKEKKKTAEVHIFTPQQIIKERGQKAGTFSVFGNVEKAKAVLQLALTFQNGKLRAVPIPSLARKDEAIIFLRPGTIEKDKAAERIQKMLKDRDMDIKKEEILNALPSGGFTIA